MNIENKEWLKSTNDFSLLGIKFLYLSNAGAILTILVNINNFVDEEEYPEITWALSLFVLGLIFAFVTNLLGYLMYRDLLISSQRQMQSKKEVILGILALCTAVASFFSFGFGAHQAVSIIEYAL
jgi:hypothetical protein